MFGSAMSVPSSVLSPGSAPSRGGSRVEWMDAVGGYSPRIRAHPSRLKIAVLDPLSLWKPFLQPTFASYQPFQGLQVKNKTQGALQKVEDLKAEVVNMYMREPPSAQAGAAATSAASTPSGSATSRARSSTSGGGIFGFGSSTPSSANSSSSSGLYVSTAADAAAPPPAFSDPASPSASSAASTLSASVPTLKHPMNWHCYPYLHILLVSPPTLDEYLRTTKGQIKRFLEYFAAPNEFAAGGGSGSTPSSARGSAANASSTPSGSGMVVAGSSLVPELRYHSEVLIIYLPTLESERDLTNTAGLMASGSFIGNGAASATNSSSVAGSFASLFKRSPSFSTPTAAAAALAEERLQALKHARKVFERMRTDFGSRDPLNNQVARIDLYEIIRQQQLAEREEGAAGGSGGSGASSAAAASNQSPDALELVHQWDDLIARIVRSLIRTHENRASLYEMELKKSLTNSHMSGWNFPAFFVLKESYAMLHQQMGLRADALRLYEELRVMCEELLQGAPDGGKSSLQYLLLSSSASPRTAASDADTDYALSSSSMPAPILDVVGKNYPLLILRGEITELEFLRYLHAQVMWISIKMNKTSGGASSASGTAGTSSAQNYLIDIMNRGRTLILSILSLIARSPSRFSAIRPEHALGWCLEAAMDLGVLCEKYLVHGYIEAYQNLTMAAQMAPNPAQMAAAAEKEAAQRAAAAAARERSTGLSNVLAAVASVIGPSASPVAAPMPAPTPASSASSSASAPSLQSQARALKASHESDLRALQMLRGDLYGLVLERIFLWAKAHPTLKLQGEVREVIEAEKQAAATGRRRRADPSSAASADAAAAAAAASAAASAAPIASRPSPRIGLDDDVYTDMLEFYYPHDVDLSAPSAANSSSDRVLSVALEDRDPRVIAPNMYVQFQARHKRILSCFAAASTAASKPALTNSAETSNETGADTAAAANSTALTVAATTPSESFTFHDLFLELCTCSLKLSSLTGRFRQSTRVSELKAVVLYNLGDYAKALDLFQANIDRFRKEKWIQILYPQMLMMLKCLMRLGRHDEVVRVALGFLMQQHQQIHSSRFRPAPSTKEEPFSWSKLGALITARKKELESGDGPAPLISSAPAQPEPPKSSSSGGPRVFPPPFLSYSVAPAGPSSAATARSHSLAVAGSALPPVVQVVLVQSDDEGNKQSQPAPSLLNSAENKCAPFLLDCCPDCPVDSADESSSDASLVSPAQIQQLLMHTLRVHLGQLFPASAAAGSSSSFDRLGIFQALRALAHRSSAMLPMFPSTPGAESPPPASPRPPASAAPGLNKRLSITKLPSVNRSSSMNGAQQQTIVVDSSDIRNSSATVLPSGPYIESSLHPFFVLRNPSLFLYRKTHPLHAVLEVDVDSRFPQAITLDALAIVIQLERQGAADKATMAPASAVATASSPLQSGARKQMSVIVTPATGLMRPAPIRITSDVAVASSTAAQHSSSLLPSPLPSQSLSASNSLENLASMHKRAVSTVLDDVTDDSAPVAAPQPDRSENNSPASPAPVVPSASPDPAPSTLSSQPAVVQVAASPTSAANLPQLPAYISPEEWECCFSDVTLQPGANRLYLHVFHSVLESDAAAAAVHSGVKEHAGSNTAQHHSIVLYHSHAQLEHIHALFEASHAHMQQVVEQRRRMSLAGVAAAPGHSRQPSLTAPQAAVASHVHSFSSTSLSLRDVWFGIGRLQMWHLDLPALNAALQTRVMTLKQRRAQLLKQAGKMKHTRSISRCNSGPSASTAPMLDLADVDLSACDDPHLQSGFVPPAPSFKPFAGKPRLSIELLPIAPSDLLIGKTSAFHIAVSISVGVAAEGSDHPRSIDKCVLHVAAAGGLQLFNVDSRASTGGVRGSLSRQSSDETNAAASMVDVFGLLRLEGSGRSEKKTFSLNLRSSDIALGTLPAGSTLFLLVPVAPPGHLTHLLRTKQITLPASSVANSPFPSRPASPSRAAAMARRGSGVGLIPSAVQGSEKQSAQTAAGADLHSVSHELSLDLTCAPGDVAGSDLLAQPAPSFMFSRYSSLTFMEPLQLSATMERLGARWFLQVCLWNRCAFAVQIANYKLELPAGFALKNDPNAGARGYVMPPLTDNAVAAGSPSLIGGSDPGAVAASLAASVPISFSSPNVYSLVFELAYEPTASAPARRNSLSADLQGEEAELAASYTSASIGRFVLTADPVCAVGSALRAAPSLSLSWPIDIALMSGAQDLHLGLSFPQRACMGRLITLTITVLHSRAADKRKRRGAQVETAASAPAAPLSLLYSVSCPSHLWLLSGKQSHAFTLAEGEQRSFSVRVLPIAAGYLPIPHVELMQAEAAQSSGQSSSVLQQVADKLAAGLEHQSQQQQQQAGATDQSSPLLRISTSAAPASSAVAAAPPSSLGFQCAPSTPLSYSSIPPSRILRHVSGHHLIHVFPTTNFATQMQPILA